MVGEYCVSPAVTFRTSFVTDESGFPGGVVTGSDAVQLPLSLLFEQDVSSRRNGHGDSVSELFAESALFEALCLIVQVPFGVRLTPIRSDCWFAPGLVASCEFAWLIVSAPVPPTDAASSLGWRR